MSKNTLIKTKWYLSPSPKACNWGILHEPRAKHQYTECTGVVIQDKGLFLSSNGLLGGSPDGMVFGDSVKSSVYGQPETRLSCRQQRIGTFSWSSMKWLVP